MSTLIKIIKLTYEYNIMAVTTTVEELMMNSVPNDNSGSDSIVSGEHHGSIHNDEGNSETKAGNKDESIRVENILHDVTSRASNVDDSDSDDEYYNNNDTLTVDHSELKGLEKKFSFYNFGGDDVPFDSILRKIKTLPNEFQYMSDNYHSINKNGSSSLSLLSSSSLDYNRFNIKEFQKTHFDSSHKNHSISQFKEKPIVWDASAPDKELLDSLYRIPQSDPSGKLILSLSRDEAKGAKAWKQPERDRPFNYPEATSYSHSFRQQLIKHMEHVVLQVEQVMCSDMMMMLIMLCSLDDRSIWHEIGSN